MRQLKEEQYAFGLPSKERAEFEHLDRMLVEELVDTPAPVREMKDMKEITYSKYIEMIKSSLRGALSDFFTDTPIGQGVPGSALDLAVDHAYEAIADQLLITFFLKSTPVGSAIRNLEEKQIEQQPAPVPAPAIHESEDPGGARALIS